MEPTTSGGHQPTPMSAEEKQKMYEEYLSIKADVNKMFRLVNLKDLPQPTVKKPLFGKYWKEGEIALLAGDMSTGKTLLGLQIAKAVASGTSCLEFENSCQPKKVLYLDFEMSKEDFAVRAGTDLPDKLLWGRQHLAAFMEDGVDTECDWLVRYLQEIVNKEDIEALILDQPDRINLTPKQWDYLLYKLMQYREFSKVSILIITNTKTRHITKAVTLKNTLQIISERVDSVFALCGSHCSPYMRYLKLLKGRNSAFNLNKVDVLWVGPPDENKGVFDLRFYEESTEENHLPLSKEKLRQQRMQAAEQLRYDGMTYQQIAEHFNMPESTVRNWVKHITPNQHDVSDEEYIEGKVQSLRRRIEENLQLVNPHSALPLKGEDNSYASLSPDSYQEGAEV